MGHSLTCAFDPISIFIAASFGDVAISLRRSFNAVDDYFVRNLVMLISRTADNGSISSQLDVSKDIMVSSWVEQNMACLDYGVFGNTGFCEEVSVCGLGGVDIFDAKGGGIHAAICFEGCRFCAVEGKLGCVWGLLCRNMLGSGCVKGVSLEYKGFR